MRKKFVLNFPAERVEEPITYKLIKDYDVVINILNADISSGREGSLLIEMKANKENLTGALEYLEKNNITFIPLEKSIHWNEKACIHCGGCTAVCFAGALTMDKKTWKLNFLPEKCVACELCLNACPLGLFESEFSESYA
jgi:ferredoxin